MTYGFEKLGGWVIVGLDVITGVGVVDGVMDGVGDAV
jgi:hypothetical protein